MTPTAASLEKKRLRDRRAQHAARARRDTQLQALQQRVEQGDKIQAQLEVEVQQLRTALDTLRAENLQLRRRHTAAIELLSGSSELAQEGANGQISQNHSSPVLPQKQLDDCSPSSTWSRVPQNFPEDSLSASLMPWLLCPAVVTHLSDTPCGPDILYGSHTNPLSNAIHIAFSCALHGTLNDPERLALGELHDLAYRKCYSSRLTTVVKDILPTLSRNGVWNPRKSALIACQSSCALPNSKLASHTRP